MDTGVENRLIALILSLDESAWGDHTVHVKYVFHLVIQSSSLMISGITINLNGILRPGDKSTTTRLSANHSDPSTSLRVATITGINLFVCELSQNTAVTGYM